MKDILIPEGWTYFAHRTNTSKWSTNPFEDKVIKVKSLMSVVTESEVKYEVETRGKNHHLGYTVGDGTPFEIRCLICDGATLRKMEDSPIKDIMYHEFYFDKNNFGGCYGQRHHSIPKNEDLVVIGISDYDEVYERESKIIWTIPRRFIDKYREDIRKNNNRSIPLSNPESTKGKTI